MSGLSPAYRAAFAGMFVMAAVMGIGRFVYTPILPLMIGDGALNAAEAGFVAGANFLGYLLGALAASLSIFAPHRRKWAFGAIALSIATGAAMSLEPGLAAMSVLRFASGLASAFAMIFSTAIVMRRLAVESRQGLTAIHFAGVGMGIALSALLVSALAGLGVQWEEIWVWTASLALAMFLCAWLLLPPPMEQAIRSEPDDTGDALPRSLWQFIASYGVFGFGYVISATFLNTMAVAVPEFRPLEPWVWAIVGLACLPSILAWNRVAARMGLPVAYALACLVEACGVLLPIVWQSPAAIVISAASLGGTFIAATALGLTFARQMAPQAAARAIALMTASFGLGQMIGPVVAGILFDRTGNLDLASILAALALLAAAILAWSYRNSRPVPQHGVPSHIR